MMRAKTETITPRRAATLLEKSDKKKINVRSRIQSSIVKMARAMREGRWELNGESIKINGDGLVVDGANRLAACVEAGVSFKTVVVYGVDDVLHADQGSKRQAGQVLAFRHQVKNSALTAAVARMLIIENLSGSISRTAGGDWQPDIEEICKFVKKNAKLLERAGQIGVACHHLCSPSSAAYAYYKARTTSGAEDEAEEFFTQLSSDNTMPGTPVHLLHNRLMRNKAGNLGNNSYALNRLDEVALLTRAWNATLSGDRPKRLVTRKHRSTAWSPENFPRFITPEELAA